jgi:hypothetical protein
MTQLKTFYCCDLQFVACLPLLEGGGLARIKKTLVILLIFKKRPVFQIN